MSSQFDQIPIGDDGNQQGPGLGRELCLRDRLGGGGEDIKGLEEFLQGKQ